jgi:hypothetical protein
VQKIIDLAPAETQADGTRVYRPPLQALMIQVVQVVTWLTLEHPRETSGVLAATAWATVFGYFLIEMLRPSKPPRAGA